MIYFAPDLLTSLIPTIAASASPVLLCLIQRLVVGRGQRRCVLLERVSSDSSQPSDLAAVCPGSAVLASRSCPFDPGAVVPLLLLLQRRDATTEAPVLVAGAPGCPTNHSVLHPHAPWAAPDLAVVRLRTRIAAPAAVVELVGRAAAIAGTGDPSPYSTRGEPGKYVNLLLCRRRSRLRGAAGASWCTVT